MGDVRQQLASAREWLRILIKQFDIDPDDTIITFSARLAESLKHIDAALAEGAP